MTNGVMIKTYIKVLNETLEWLIKWESNLNENLIGKNDFLTQNTADGLKITLQSTIDAVNYLLNEKNFAYVLKVQLRLFRSKYSAPTNNSIIQNARQFK